MSIAHDFAFLADLPGQWDRQPARTAAYVQYGHARLKVQMLDNDVRAMDFRKRIVKFNKPTQPHRAGERMTAGSDPPQHGDENY
jgi:hypothetical protein